jgi:hypothetical protein
MVTRRPPRTDTGDWALLVVASTRRMLCYTLLLASRAMTDLEARWTAIEDFAGLAGSFSRHSSGIESAETEGDRAYYCTCAVRGIFPAVLPWLLPWPTPRMRIVAVWQACTEDEGQARRAGLVDDMELCTAASRMRKVSVGCIHRRADRLCGRRKSEIIQHYFVGVRPFHHRWL